MQSLSPDMLPKNMDFENRPILLYRRSKAYSLTFCPKKRILKIGLFYEKAKPIALHFAQKTSILNICLFYRKSKAYSLALCPKIWIMKSSLFYRISKAYSLTFVQKWGMKSAYFTKKGSLKPFFPKIVTRQFKHKMAVHKFRINTTCKRKHLS